MAAIVLRSSESKFELIQKSVKKSIQSSVVDTTFCANAVLQPTRKAACWLRAAQKVIDESNLAIASRAIAAIKNKTGDHRLLTTLHLDQEPMIAGMDFQFKTNAPASKHAC